MKYKKSEIGDKALATLQMTKQPMPFLDFRFQATFCYLQYFLSNLLVLYSILEFSLAFFPRSFLSVHLS